MNLQLPGALRKKQMAEVHPAIGAEEVDPEGVWHCTETFAKQRWWLWLLDVGSMSKMAFERLRDLTWREICLDFGRWLEILDTNQPRTYTLHVHSALIISYIYLMYRCVTIFRIRSMHLQIEELVNLGDFGMNCMSSQKASLKRRSVLKFQLLLLWASWKGYRTPWWQAVTK